MSKIDLELTRLGKDLATALDKLKFSPPVTHVYNPLRYAWGGYEEYLRRFATTRKRVLFLGMNPGPFGMMQTGVPFGEIQAVRQWLGLSPRILRPASEHPKRPVQGMDCPRSEVSGKRLWGLFAARFGTATAFFEEHLVLNYCPLAFLELSGKNRTPNSLPAQEREPLNAVCNTHLRAAIELIRPEWIVGIGDFAAGKAAEVMEGLECRHCRILHPSPASPAANRDWAGAATKQLIEAGVWAR